MRLVSIVGARPQFIKIAPVCRAIERHNQPVGNEPIEDTIVHTGQHYDPGMSDIFFEQLAIPPAAIDLEVGSGQHGEQTARMLKGIEAILLDRRPDMVVVYGDTNSTIAGALAAAKLHIPVAHVEAGLRSFKRSMPEEINRVATDHMSDLLLAPTPTAMKNLEAERLADRARWTGDVMYDAVIHNRQIAAKESDVLRRLEIEPRGYGIVTIHRAENADGAQLRPLMEAVNEVAYRHVPLIFPVHPRTAKRLKADLGDVVWRKELTLIEPLGYLDMLRLLADARVALTDSGGLQKEAFFLDCPCITLREETEWLETVEGGGNLLAGSDVSAILGAVATFEERYGECSPDFSAAIGEYFGEGHAADMIVAAMEQYCRDLI